MENSDRNNKSNESEAEVGIKLEDKMNQNILICQINRANSQCQQGLVPIIALCMFSYGQSQRFNIHQMIKSHFTFAYNVAKRYVDILHSMGLCISYETICIALKNNTKEIELKI